MYLSDRDLRWALDHKQLLVHPRPDDKHIGPTSIDLHLDKIEEAKVWNIEEYCKDSSVMGHGDSPELPIGQFQYEKFAKKFLIRPGEDKNKEVFCRGKQIIIKPHGFVLWQTKERVGTPEEGAQLICFVDGKSTRARTGILVHMTAPTIHAAWGAWPITLEIGNFGPFHLVLQEDDVIAQITVAGISSIPARSARQAGSVTSGQTDVAGAKSVQAPAK